MLSIMDEAKDPLTGEMEGCISWNDTEIQVLSTGFVVDMDQLPVADQFTGFLYRILDNMNDIVSGCHYAFIEEYGLSWFSSQDPREILSAFKAFTPRIACIDPQKATIILNAGDFMGGADFCIEVNGDLAVLNYYLC